MYVANAKSPATSEPVHFATTEAFQTYVVEFYNTHDPPRGPEEAYAAYRRLMDHVSAGAAAETTAGAPAAGVQHAILNELYALYPAALSNVVTTALIRYAPSRLGTGEEAALVREFGDFVSIARHLMAHFDLTFGDFLPRDVEARKATRCREVWLAFFGGGDVGSRADRAGRTADQDIEHRLQRAGGTMLDEATTARRFEDECYADASDEQRRRSVLWNAVFTADAQQACNVDVMLREANGDSAEALRRFREHQRRNCERRELEDHLTARLGVAKEEAVNAACRAMITRQPGTDLFNSLSQDRHVRTSLHEEPRGGASPPGIGASPYREAPPRSIAAQMTRRRFSPPPPSSQMAAAMQQSAGNGTTDIIASPEQRAGAANTSGSVAHSALVDAYMRLRQSTTSAPLGRGILSPSAPFSSTLDGVVNAPHGDTESIGAAAYTTSVSKAGAASSSREPGAAGALPQLRAKSNEPATEEDGGAGDELMLDTPKPPPSSSADTRSISVPRERYASPGGHSTPTWDPPRAVVAATQQQRTVPRDEVSAIAPASPGETPTRSAAAPNAASGGSPSVSARDTDAFAEAASVAVEAASASLRRERADMERAMKDFYATEESAQRDRGAAEAELKRREAEVAELRETLERTAKTLAAQQATITAKENEARTLEQRLATRERDLARREEIVAAGESKAPEEADRLRRIARELNERESELEELQRDCESVLADVARREAACERRLEEAETVAARGKEDVAREAARLNDAVARREAKLGEEREAFEAERSRWTEEQDAALEERTLQAVRLREADDALRRHEKDVEAREKAAAAALQDAERREALARAAEERAAVATEDAQKRTVEAMTLARSLETQASAVDQHAQRLVERERALWKVTALSAGVPLGTTGSRSSSASSRLPPPDMQNLQSTLDVVNTRLKAMSAASSP